MTNESKKGGIPDVQELLQVLDKHGVLARGMLPHQIDRELAAHDDIKKLWEEACAIAREYCPVEEGESHIRKGIPRLAKRVLAAKVQMEDMEARIIQLREELAAMAAERDAARTECKEWRAAAKAIADLVGVSRRK